MARTLNGKTALVSGAGRGIGRAIALKLALSGANLVVNDLDEDPARQVVADIEAMGGQAVAVAGNICAPDFAEKFVGTAVDRFGGLEIIVNNAGYTWDSVIQKMSDEQWNAILDVHLTAPFRILRAAQPVIRELANADRQAHRRIVRKIVNISSMAGMFGNAGQVNYTAAKAGVVGMTQTLAKEWGRLDTTVNCVAFGLIRTRMTVDASKGETTWIEGREIRAGINPDLLAAMERSIPLGRGGTPEEAAGAVYLLTLPESDYVSGQTLVCSGGLTGI
jgi:3-oxoacyl-[acyl-carrier protein] reductase